MNLPVTPADPASPLASEDFDTLDTLLDDLRTRDDEVPQWEFCEGAMAALLCTRRPIPSSEYLPLLLGGDASEGPDFPDPARAAQFMALWTRRWNEVATALSTAVDTLEDERSYHPEVMDVRGAVASLPEAERAEIGDQDLPAYAQVWALGFMFVVENWPDDWAAPRDPETADWLDGALNAIVTLTEDDTARPTVSLHSEDGPPSVSEARLNQFGEALWAVYDLRQLWHSLGPRVEPVRRAETPGRNDPCPCGSGKKYKKCHGAA